MTELLRSVLALQRDIYFAFAERIRDFADTGDWWPLAAWMPLGIVFGAAHALTPGHGKAVLASYLSGSRASLARALAASLTLSFTHIAMSLLIVLLSLPLVRFGLGSEAGRAPALELLSRALLAAVGFWMLWRAIKGAGHDRVSQGSASVGFMAGLIPCPLTLFVMTLAVTRGVPEAGAAFAVATMTGVALTMAAVALASLGFRNGVLLSLAERPRLLSSAVRLLQALGGLALITLAATTLLGSN